MLISIFLLLWVNGTLAPPAQFDQGTRVQARSAHRSLLTGVYRIDVPASDKLYSVVAGASSNIPFGDQQRFFIDLAVRLTPPDLLAIEQQGTRISLGSSRAPRMSFVADGVRRSARTADGHIVRVRFSVEKASQHDRLVFTSDGRTEDDFTVTFESLDDGKRLLVIRRIAAESLDEPLVIRTVYNKISDVARWELYGEPQVATPVASAVAQPTSPKSGPASDRSTADLLRNALNEWISSTISRDIDKQMSFYVPRLKAYYLTRNTPRVFVHREKARVFATASLIDIRAAEPEIILQDGGRLAIMRYRKKYRIENGRQSRRGEVIQELRWRQVGQQWLIFSERDIRVL